MADVPNEAARSARELSRRTGVEHHDVLVILGTGLAPVAQHLGATGPSIPLATLPFFPKYTATGHHAQGWSVPIGDKVVLIFAGRCHLYEGLEIHEVVHPLLTGIATGCSTVILTAAVGGINPSLPTGSLMAVADQINLTSRTPLVGPEFIDMVDAYNPVLRAAAQATPGLEAPLPEGVYAQVLGPQFETPAEVAALRTMGADVVGMSMGMETIAARHAGADVLGLALVTNAAAGAFDLGHIAQSGNDAVPTVASVISHVVRSLP